MMNNNTMRLTESGLRRVVRSAVRNALMESWDYWRPEENDDISDYSFGMTAKLMLKGGVMGLSEETIDALESIKDEYAESANSYVSVMVRSVEVVLAYEDEDPEYNDYDVYVNVGITAPDMPLDRIENETEDILWYWFEEKSGVRIPNGFGWEEEEVVFDRRAKHQF